MIKKLCDIQCVILCVEQAEKTLASAEKLTGVLQRTRPNFNLAFLYTEYSMYYFLKGLYPEVIKCPGVVATSVPSNYQGQSRLFSGQLFLVSYSFFFFVTVV
jgi:hypothetical protein